MKLINAFGPCFWVIFVLSGCTTAPTVPESDAPAERSSLETSFSEAVRAMEQGDHDEARARFEQLARDYPDKAGPMVNLGIIAFQEKDSETAAQWFERALAVNPEQVQALNHLGVIARSAGKFDEAQGIITPLWQWIRITRLRSLIWLSF